MNEECSLDEHCEEVTEDTTLVEFKDTSGVTEAAATGDCNNEFEVSPMQ